MHALFTLRNGHQRLRSVRLNPFFIATNVCEIRSLFQIRCIL